MTNVLSLDSNSSKNVFVKIHPSMHLSINVCITYEMPRYKIISHATDSAIVGNVLSCPYNWLKISILYYTKYLLCLYVSFECYIQNQ